MHPSFKCVFMPSTHCVPAVSRSCVPLGSHYPHLVVDHSLATANGRMANAICRGEYNHGGVTLGDTLVDPHTLIDDATTPVSVDMRPLTDASG